MSMKRCKNGHFFDPSKHTYCPHCGVSRLKVGKTQSFGGDEAPPSPRAGATKKQGSASNETSPAKRKRVSATEEEVVTRRHGGVPEKAKKVEKEGVTMVKIRESTGIDPVVGWLVCIEGPDKGRDYRIRTERNFIGRKDSNDIVIKGDDSISREKHAIISFNPRKLSFRLAPGDSRGLIYHNDEEVLTPLELNAYDILEMGETKLMFVPFCTGEFSWEAKKNSKSIKEDKKG